MGSTRSEALEQCQLAVSRLASSNLEWLSLLLLLMSPLRSNLWRCTTSLFPRLSPVTTLASTSRTSPSRKSVVATSPRTPRTTQPRSARTSTRKSSSSTTPERSRTVTHPSWIATPPTLLANLRKSSRDAINASPSASISGAFSSFSIDLGDIHSFWVISLFSKDELCITVLSICPPSFPTSSFTDSGIIALSFCSVSLSMSPISISFCVVCCCCLEPVTICLEESGPVDLSFCKNLCPCSSYLLTLSPIVLIDELCVAVLSICPPSSTTSYFSNSGIIALSFCSVSMSKRAMSIFFCKFVVVDENHLFVV